MTELAIVDNSVIRKIVAAREKGAAEIAIICDFGFCWNEVRDEAIKRGFESAVLS